MSEQPGSPPLETPLEGGPVVNPVEVKEEKPPEVVTKPNVDAREAEGQFNFPGSMRDANYTKIQEQINTYLGFSPQAQEESKPLIDLATELPPSGSDTCYLEPAQVQEYCAKLKTSRLLLISCIDKEIAVSSACAIADALDQTNTSLKRLFLDFERITKTNVVPDDFLVRSANETKNQNTKENGEVVIVLDMIGRYQDTKAQEFLASLTRSSISVFSFNLKQKHVSLVCLVDETIQASGSVGRKLFEDLLHLEVSFLRALLKQHFPETYEHVQTKVEQQRRRWDPDDRVFCRQIINQIKQKQLLSLLDTAYTPDEINIESLFKEDDINQDVRLVVLFVGTFCPNLNPREFHRVVSLLLGDRTRTITVTTTRINDKGIVETVDVKEERSLRELWEQRSDKIKEECYLHSLPDTKITRVIDFKDYRLRPLLKQRFEQEHAFFTSTHIEGLFRAGLLFDISPRIGESLMTITAASAASDPDYYGTELVLETVTKFERASETNDITPIHEVVPFQLLADLGQAEASYRVYHRISYLLRTLLDQYKLQSAIHSVMEQLVRREFYKAVFKIVIRLRFTEGFDEYHWLKQLLERGKTEVQNPTLGYLHTRLRDMGTKVHEVLAGLDDWLPKYENKKEQPTTQQKAASKSGKYALVLLMAYCLEKIEDLEDSDYGAWPSRHPLFVFADDETATTNLAILARWLFHPWMKDAFPKIETEEDEAGDINDLICDLIFHWILVLIGPPRDECDGERLEPITGPNAITVSQILIQQIVLHANEEQRQYMLTRWQAASKLMLAIIKELPYGSEHREILIWQRSLLDDLITQFQDYAEARESSRAA